MKADNPIKDFVLDPSKAVFVGTDLQRPECILAEPNGDLWVADARGGVAHIKPDGSQKIITQKYADKIDHASGEVMRYFEGTLPNGLAFASNGDILISNFGTDCLERMKRTGETEILFDTVNGKEIGKVNFVLRDSKDRLWITITTMRKNWLDALDPNLADGYIARYDDRGIHIVADGLMFTNEVRFDKNEEYLYVVQTTGGNVLRFRCDANGDLHDREIYGPTHMGKGAYPDGIAFDTYGNLWGTSVYSDMVWVITPDGEFKVLLDEGDPVKVKALDDAFRENRVTYDLLFETGRGIAPWMASVTFGGKDLKKLYLGSLRATNIPCWDVPVAGLPMVHWK
ncbi:MAG: SMP-30/gluconolactonase/LRE family protein [Oscillospiraceae bacterium]|nr:SMP-30/gluconolactonase/LRE family protein [Oscillospiraceae bacterium]